MSFNFGRRKFILQLVRQGSRGQGAWRRPRLALPCCFDSFIDFSCCCQLCVDVDDERKEGRQAQAQARGGGGVTELTTMAAKSFRRNLNEKICKLHASVQQQR